MALANLAGGLLGTLIGYLGWYFVTKLKTYTVQGLVSVIGAFVGGAAIKLLASNPNAVWWYIIGLFIGTLIYFIFYIIKHHQPPLIGG